MKLGHCILTTHWFVFCHVLSMVVLAKHKMTFIPSLPSTTCRLDLATAAYVCMCASANSTLKRYWFLMIEATGNYLL